MSEYGGQHNTIYSDTIQYIISEHNIISNIY